MSEFDKERIGTGTAEWADVNENICRGCPNDCLYCYAAANAKRFKLRDRDGWHNEEFTKRAFIEAYPAKQGVIMFPSAHDITPFNVHQYIRIAKLMLEKGNRLLIVSKPRIECVQKMLEAFQAYRENILFRFTIGTTSPRISKLWEPGAPLPEERFDCLDAAFTDGFKTSVSIEPMLDNGENTVGLVKHCQASVTDTIWIGKMNKISLRVGKITPAIAEAIEVIQHQQTDDEILHLHRHLKDNKKVRWKDSIKEILVRHNARL